MRKDIDFGFLFGAGTSQAFGLPSTEEITNTILGSLLTCRSNERFYIDANLPQGEDECCRFPSRRKKAIEAQTFLGCLCDFIHDFNTKYSSLRVDSNFESIYYLCHQIAESLRGYYVNPALGPLLLLLQTDEGPFHEFRSDKYQLVSKSIDYIIDVTASLLSRYAVEFNDHDFLKNAYNARGDKSLDVFSLNYDLQIEEYCKAHKLALMDGFAPCDTKNGLRAWDPSQYQVNTHGLRLFKLHGSINWYFWYPAEDRNNQTPGISVDPYRSEVSHGSKKLYSCKRPIMLVGLQNKVLEYSSGLRLELLCAAKKAWDSLDVLVVIGYSFRDQGINRLLYDWGNKDSKRKLIVVCRNKRRFLQKASPVFSVNTAQEWIPKGKLIYYERDFKELAWDEIEQKMTEITS